MILNFFSGSVMLDASRSRNQPFCLWDSMMHPGLIICIYVIQKVPIGSILIHKLKRNVHALNLCSSVNYFWTQQNDTPQYSNFLWMILCTTWLENTIFHSHIIIEFVPFIILNQSLNMCNIVFCFLTWMPYTRFILHTHVSLWMLHYTRLSNTCFPACYMFIIHSNKFGRDFCPWHTKIILCIKALFCPSIAVIFVVTLYTHSVLKIFWLLQVLYTICCFVFKVLVGF